MSIVDFEDEFGLTEADADGPGDTPRSRIVLGLDLSSTATGICEEAGLFKDDDADSATFTCAPTGDLLTRARAMRHSVKEATKYGLDLVVMEGIGTRFVQTAIAIATVHALVLDAIADDCRILHVSPAQLKKWATGKGNADKTAMLLAAKRGGWRDPEGATDDQADAWWLWTIGHAVLGTWKVPETEYRTKVLADLTGANATA